MNGWKTLTDMVVNAQSIALIEGYCSELLIHAADVEGLCQGIDEELVKCEYRRGCRGEISSTLRSLLLASSFCSPSDYLYLRSHPPRTH